MMIAEKLFDADYVREQTDLPFLIRTDDGRFLRESDIVADGRDDVFAIWDEAHDRLQLAPGSQGSRSGCARCSRDCASASTATIDPSRRLQSAE
ncbi:MAG: hypothetical protein JRG94_13125 [Deltaproteobacteria bacterium]|nr:hypothetical protein [Deltaproteobacteria bacterium]